MRFVKLLALCTLLLAGLTSHTDLLLATFYDTSTFPFATTVTPQSVSPSATPPFMHKPWRNITPTISARLDHDSQTLVTPRNQKMSGTYFDGVRYVSMANAGIECNRGYVGTSPLVSYKKTADGHCMSYDGHSGYDYPMPDGTKIYPVATGTYYRRTQTNGSIYGEVIHNGNGTGYVTWYVHISKHLVPDGFQITDVNTPIAESGGGHLHLTVRKDGKFVDPYGWWGTEADPLTTVSVGTSNGWLWLDEAPPQDNLITSTGHFPDVTINNTNFGFIEALYSIGAINGFSDGTYRPDESATRGNAAQIIVRSLGIHPEYSDGQTLCNVSPTNSSYPYIRWMLEAGISTCPSNGNWNPDDFLTRGGLAKFIVLARGESPNYGCNPPFPDVPCNYTFYDEIRRLNEIFTQKNVQLGYSDGTFRPDEAISRAGIAKLVIVGLDLENHIPSFYDVLFDNKFYPFVEEIAAREITSGCTSNLPPLFCPEDVLTRGGIAKWVILAMGENPIYNDNILPFPDVPTNHTFYPFIRRLKDLGITSGYSDGTYKPDLNVTRGAVAKFIVQALFVRGTTCLYNLPQAFPDVPPTHGFYREVQCLKELGITSGFSDGTFKPDKEITRGEASKFIYLAFIERTPSVSQEASNQTNNACNTSSPTYTPWDRYVVPAGDVDCFKLPVTIIANDNLLLQSPVSYRIATNYVGLNADLRIDIVASNGAVLSSATGQGQNGGTSLIWSPSNSGTYYVKLTNTRNFALDGVYAYMTAEQVTLSYLPVVTR